MGWLDKYEKKAQRGMALATTPKPGSAKAKRRAKSAEKWERIQGTLANNKAHKESTEQARLENIRDNHQESFNKMSTVFGALTPFGIEDLAVQGALKNVSKVGPFLKNFKKSFKNKIPITNAQKASVIAKQDKAFKEGLDFVDEWNYAPGSNKLRPDVERKIVDMSPSWFTYSKEARLKDNPGNPFNKMSDKLVGHKNKQIDKANISDYAKKYLKKNKDRISGFNNSSTGESITLRSDGILQNSPGRIREVGIHEKAHTMQGLGDQYGEGFGNHLAKFDPNITGYYAPNMDTKIGQEFAKHMKPHKGKGKSTWAASPNELHSELMVSRNKLQKYWKKKNPNYTNDELIHAMQQEESPEILDWLIESNKLDRFFKKGTSRADKHKLLRYLPGVAAPTGLGTVLANEEEKSFKNGGNLPKAQRGMVMDTTPPPNSDKAKRRAKSAQEWERIQGTIANVKAHKESTEKARLENIRDNHQESFNKMSTVFSAFTPFGIEDLAVQGAIKGATKLAATTLGKKAVDISKPVVKAVNRKVKQLKRKSYPENIVPKGGFKKVEDAEILLERLGVDDSVVPINQVLEEYGSRYNMADLELMAEASPEGRLRAINEFALAYQKSTNNFEGMVDDFTFLSPDKYPAGTPVNLSKLSQEDAIKVSKNEFKNLATDLTEEEFARTVVKPGGGIVKYDSKMKPFEGAAQRDEFNLFKDEDTKEFVDTFNTNISEFNKIIQRNNNSGEAYEALKLSPDGGLWFKSDKGVSNFSTGITPGRFKGEIGDNINEDYFASLPGLSMRSTSKSVFGDGKPRKGTGAYKSLNEYLKSIDLGRVKSGNNSQTIHSRKLWESSVKKDKAVGYYPRVGVVHGVMKNLAAPVGLGGAAAAAANTEKKNGGWLDKFENGGVIEDDRGQWAHPGEVTKINSNQITMKGVDYPVLGISNTGDKQLMQPGQEYSFKGDNVTEYPIKAQKGGWLDKY